MRARAAGRLPGVPLIDADMWNFDVERQFDAVICLFSVIGYAGGPDGSLAGLRKAIDTMVAHLVPGGVLVIEPWIYPRQFEPGHIANDYCHAGDRYIYRMGHSRIAPDRPRVSELTLHYLVGQASGIEHFTDVHQLSMFTRRDLTTTIKRAGCTAEILEPGFGRSLIVGVRT
jgi:dTDP-3-amino-3,4,6-trideoxy-alpha-D-glucopyranose N,N-dimethyltransferase